MLAGWGCVWDAEQAAASFQAVPPPLQLVLGNCISLEETLEKKILWPWIPLRNWLWATWDLETQQLSSQTVSVLCVVRSRGFTVTLEANSAFVLEKHCRFCKAVAQLSHGEGDSETLNDSTRLSPRMPCSWTKEYIAEIMGEESLTVADERWMHFLCVSSSPLGWWPRSWTLKSACLDLTLSSYLSVESNWHRDTPVA